MQDGLSTRLRNETRKSHTKAQKVAFMKSFAKGKLSRDAYQSLLVNLYFVYSTLETEFERNQAHPILGKVYFPNLNRSESLGKDLEFFLGPNWQAGITISQAGAAYIERLREVSANSPVLLLGHQYTRYLGDLSGGQLLKSIAEKALNLEEGQGNSFYVFKEIPDYVLFKENYRRKLDELKLDEATENLIVAEANLAFGLNINLFKEIGIGMR